MNGHGVFYFSNGDRYEGNFENGLKHGKFIRLVFKLHILIILNL